MRDSGKGGPPKPPRAPRIGSRRDPGRQPGDDAPRNSRRQRGRPPVTGAQPVKADPSRGDRIAKLLARAGVASRRDIERMIAEGKVALNGQPVTTPATILQNLAGVTVDGHPVAEADATRLFLFHKPAGFLTAARDPAGRPTIYDALPEGLPRLVPVGRLDLNTEGLLLLTNDGELKRALELPATGVPRTYRVRAYGEVRQSDLEALAEGVTIEGVRYGSVNADVERRTGRNVWLLMTLTEGKNREVRRLCEAMGLQVSRLIRVGYGPFQLGDIPPRGLGEATPGQIAELRQQLKLQAPPQEPGSPRGKPRGVDKGEVARAGPRPARDGGASPPPQRAKPPAGQPRPPRDGSPEARSPRKPAPRKRPTGPRDKPLV